LEIGGKGKTKVRQKKEGEVTGTTHLAKRDGSGDQASLSPEVERKTYLAIITNEKKKRIPFGTTLKH